MSGGREPENAIDLGPDSESWSNKSRNSWIRYDFGRRRVTPTIRSLGCGPGSLYPRSWALEVSSDVHTLSPPLYLQPA